MNKQKTIEEIVEEIKDWEIANKVIRNIKINEKKIHENRKNCIWYGGEIISFNYKDFYVEIAAKGDVTAYLYDHNKKLIQEVKDRTNNGSFYEIMNPYIKDDKDLLEKIEKEELIIDYGNWFNIEIYDKENNYIADESLDEDDLLKVLKDYESIIEILETFLENI